MAPSVVRDAPRTVALRRPLSIPAPTTKQLLSLYLLVGVVFATAVGMRLDDPDMWWHLRTGQLISETHTIPHADPYSFTAPGKAWIAHSWLSDLTFYGASSVAGFLGVQLLKAVLLTATFAVLLALLRRLTGSQVVAVLATAIAALVSMVGWTPRPQLFTFLFSAVFLTVLWRAERENDRLLWALPFVMLLWVNLHGGFVTGFLLLGAWTVPAGIQWALHRDRSSWRRFRALLFTVGGCLGVSVLNPWGPRLWEYPLQYAGSSYHAAYITEWFSPDFHQQSFLPFLMLLLGLLGVLAIGVRRLSLTEVLLLMGFGYLSLTSARHIPLFALATAPTVALQFSAIAASLRREGVAPLPAASRRVPFLQVANLLLVVFPILWAVGQTPRNGTWAACGRADSYPIDAAKALQLFPEPMRMFNNYGWGGFLIHELYPQHRVFIDGRADMYGADLMDDYMATSRVQPGWDGVLTKWNIDTVVWPKDWPLSAILRKTSGWDEVYHDRTASIFRRAGAAPMMPGRLQ